jgi:hypothetical protein
LNSVGEMYVLDSWWCSDPGGRFKAALQKQFGAVLRDDPKGRFGVDPRRGSCSGSAAQRQME